MNWDKYFLELAGKVAEPSKDRSTKLGCVIVGESNEILSTGYNGFPRGVNDDIDERHDRPLKYKWTEHAERNAIYNAARSGIRLKNSRIYVPWFPCADCARAIIQSGITEVICYSDGLDAVRWKEDFEIAKTMFIETNTSVVLIDKD